MENGDDDGVEAAAEVGVEQRAPVQATAHADGDFFEVEVERIHAEHLLHELVHARAQDGLRDAVGADLERRDDLVGAGAEQLVRRGLLVGARHDE